MSDLSLLWKLRKTLLIVTELKQFVPLLNPILIDRTIFISFMKNSDFKFKKKTRTVRVESIDSTVQVLRRNLHRCSNQCPFQACPSN